MADGSPARVSRWHLFLDDAQRLATPVPWPARLAAWLTRSGDVGVERHDLTVRHGFAPRPLRIAFASDFHAGPITPASVIDAAIARLTEARPDVLLLGGDFVSLHASDADALAPRLAAIPAPLGRFAVLGNHDHLCGGAAVARTLEAAGIPVLTNRSVRLPAPFDGIGLCGIDDHTAGRPDADAAFGDPAPVRIVLMHAPSNLIDIGARRFDVAFCGHTHGGQITLPGGRPVFTAVGPLSRRYSAGRFHLPDAGTLLVSRGVGFTALPIRLNSPSSITLCTLTVRS